MQRLRGRDGRAETRAAERTGAKNKRTKAKGATPFCALWSMCGTTVVLPFRPDGGAAGRNAETA
jgi:hypothetical protein